MAVKKGFLYQFSLFIVPPLFRLLTGVLFASCRVERHGFENFRKCAESGQPFIVAFWHYGLFFNISRSEGLKYVGMVSPSRDAEYVSRTLHSMGVETVRGSRSKGGLGAMRGILRAIKKGRTAVLVADGSQGPARKVQAGAILLAAMTGAPIIGVGWGANRYRAFKSWDRTALPMPFARISLWYSVPLSVPRKPDGETIERYSRILEERLNDLYEKSWGEFGIENH